MYRRRRVRAADPEVLTDRLAAFRIKLGIPILVVTVPAHANVSPLHAAVALCPFAGREYALTVGRAIARDVAQAVCGWVIQHSVRHRAGVELEQPQVRVRGPQIRGLLGKFGIEASDEGIELGALAWSEGEALGGAGEVWNICNHEVPGASDVELLTRGLFSFRGAWRTGKCVLWKLG
jgi:hypothetical protein